MDLSPMQLITLRILLEHIFRDHENCRAFLDLMGAEKYDLARDLWYSVSVPTTRSA